MGVLFAIVCQSFKLLNLNVLGRDLYPLIPDWPWWCFEIAIPSFISLFMIISITS